MIPMAVLRWLPYVAAIVALFGFGYYQGSRNGAVNVAQCEASHAAYVAKVQADATASSELARKQEQQWSEDLAMAAAKFEDEKARVVHETEASVLADVRAGRVRVRFPVCPRVPATAEAAASIAGDHGEAVGGNEAADLAAGAIAIGAEADAQLAACQATLTAERSK